MKRNPLTDTITKHINDLAFGPSHLRFEFVNGTMFVEYEDYEIQITAEYVMLFNQKETLFIEGDFFRIYEALLNNYNESVEKPKSIIDNLYVLMKDNL